MSTRPACGSPARPHGSYVVTDGTLTVTFPHPKRGREAIEEIGIIPPYEGVLIHDCWAAYMGYDQCRHQLCGSHLQRETCHRVDKSASKTLNEADRRAVCKRYRTILTQGARELPDIPPRTMRKTWTHRTVRRAQPA